MKNVLSLMFAVIFAIGICFSAPIKVSAASSSDLKFELSADRNYYSVSASNVKLSGKLEIPSTYKGLPVKKIEGQGGVGAFFNCSDLTSVVIPNSVTSIGSEAFKNCTSLASITIPDTVSEIDCEVFHNTAYYNNKNNWTNDVLYIGNHLIEAKISDSRDFIVKNGTKCIAAYAVSGNPITTLTFPSSLKSISRNAFSSCNSLVSVVFKDSATNIGECAFFCCGSLKKVDFGKNVKSIGVQAFERCTSLTSVTMPDAMTSIGSLAFCGCSSLSKIILGSKMNSIGEYAFSGTAYYDNKKNWEKGSLYIGNNLIVVPYTISGSYSIKNGTRCIADYAFHEREKLSQITIPDTLTSIGAWAFASCSKLSSVVLPNSVTQLGESAFYNCKSLNKVKFSSKLVSISAVCFYNCDSLLNVVLPSSVKSIERDAFSNCTALKSVKIPSSVKTIADRAFVSCISLSNITVPNSVSYIGLKTFGYNFNTKTQKYERIKGFTIEGKKGSVAEKYAKENKISFVVEKITLATPSVKTSNSAKGIKLSWGKIANAESYKVYRRTYNTSTKKYSKWTTLNKAVKSTSYVDTKVKLGTTYSYMVKAENGGVLSKGTATKNLKYNVTPKVTVKNTTSGVSVSWSTAANATGYTIYSSTYNAKTKKWSKFTSRGTVKSTAKSWTDKKAKSGTKYKYTVKAMNGKVASSYNKNGVEILFLATPTTKIANASSGVSVKWNKISGAKNYRIYRSTYNTKTKNWSDWSTLVTVKNNVVSYTDKKVKSGTTYRYTVKALNGKVASSNKATGKLIFLSLPEAKISNAANGIKVSWEKVAGAKSYIVYSATYDAKNKKWSSWTNRGTIEAAKLSWTDTKVQSGVQYKYTLKAVNGDYKSTNKSSSAIVYLAPPVVTVEASGKVANIKWTKSAGAEGYYIYRKSNNATEWTKIATIKSDSYIDSNVVDGTYAYSVRAYNKKSLSYFDKKGVSIVFDSKKAVFDLVNKERKKAGVPELEYYTVGQQAGDIRAKEISKVFSHDRPDGTICFTVFDELKISYMSAGENIAWGQGSPEQVMNDWMNSQGHKDNILNPNFTHIIVGYDSASNSWVQLFLGQPESSEQTTEVTE